MGKRVKKILPIAAEMFNVWLCGKKIRVSEKELEIIISSKSDKEALEKINI